MILLAFVVFLRFEIPRVMPKLSPMILLRLLALAGYKLAYLAVLALFSAVALAADEVDYPSAAPAMIYIDDDGKELPGRLTYVRLADERYPSVGNYFDENGNYTFSEDWYDINKNKVGTW